MKKIIHDYDSVSEYFLDSNKVITEIKYLSNNRTKKYVYGEDNPIYHSLISLFEHKDYSYEITESKCRSINEYRQNKDCFYLNN